LTLAEYNRLLDLAAKPAPPSMAAPVAAVLGSADLRVRVGRDTAQGTFAVAGTVLRDGVHRVPVLSGATLVDGTLAGSPLPLVSDSNGHAALVTGPGPFSLSLQWGTPLAFRPGRASFVLPVPPSSTAKATIDVPGDQADVHLSNGVITSRSTNAGRTIVEATLRPGMPTEVWWSMRESAPVAAAREVRTVADVMTLLTLGDSDVRMASLIDVTVIQGEPRTLDVRLPPGYEVTNISGSSLETSEPRAGGIVLTVGDPTLRRHQFLIGLERPHGGGSFAFETGFVTLPTTQRERGEVAIEGVGTLELSAADREGMQRIDVRELNPALQSLARTPMLAAFRYLRNVATPPGLAVDVKRFGDAGVLAAVADRAVATTIVTAEGRALTEVSLQVRNRAQPFLRVTLPAGATLASVEVAGEPAKPVLGADGTRVPLLRPGFRPSGPYQVSFVYLHAGTPFARKGDLPMTLPKVDMPIGIVEWEVFAPESYAVRAIGGNVIDSRLLVSNAVSGVERGGAAGAGGKVSGGVLGLDEVGGPGRIRGRVTDASGAVLPGVGVTLSVGAFLRSTVTGPDGAYGFAGVPSGSATLTAVLPGFMAASNTFTFDDRSLRADFTLQVGALQETVTVTAESSKERKVASDLRNQAPSQNVVNLQQRAAGVLPIRVDVPRAGTSHRFIKPLVVDQDTTVTLRYERR
jgi:hypothetical protein